MDEKNILSDLVKFITQVEQVIKTQDSFSKEYVTNKDLQKIVQGFVKQTELFAEWMNKSKKTTETLVSKEIDKVVSMLNETIKRMNKTMADKGLAVDVKFEALKGEVQGYVDTIKTSMLWEIEWIKEQMKGKLEQKDIEWLIAKSNESIIDDEKQGKDKTYSSNKIEVLVAETIKKIPQRRDASGGSPVFIKDNTRDRWYANVLKFPNATVDIVNNETVITTTWWSWNWTRWSITWTISNQTDLQNALDAKLPYTGAIDDLNLWTFDILSDTRRATTSAGMLIESANGTDVWLLWAGNTANVTWYWNHNYSTATQDTIAIFTGTWKTLWSAATATYPSLTELSYVKWVTSAIQTQLNTKQASDAQLTSIAWLSYTANALKVVRVNAWETDFELATIWALTDWDKWDITVSASGATWTVDNNAITFAKMQAITDGKLLGASWGTAIEEITVGTWLSLASNTLSVASFKWCRVKKSWAQNLTGTGLSAVNFDAETFDTDTMHNNATNNTRITFTTAWYYSVTMIINTDVNAVAYGGIRLNGSTYIGKAGIGNSWASTGNGVTVTVIYNFAATDYVEVLASFGTAWATACKVWEDGCLFMAHKID